MSQRLHSRLLVALTAFAVLLLAAPLAFAYGDRDGSRDRGNDRNRGNDRDRGNDLQFATIKDDNKLVVFSDHGRRTRQINVNGAPLAEDFVGIDVRPTGPKAGGLYGITRTGNIYLINRRNGSAQLVSTSTVTPAGNSFGVDFNPVVDRLRVISDQDQNLRINVDTGAALLDGPIRYREGDRNSGTNPAATGAGYTYAPFSMQMPPRQATTLYDIETQADFLTTQTPANDGTLNSVGSLNRDVGPQVGFDIAGKRSFDAYGLFQEAGQARLYEVSLRDGDTDYAGIRRIGTNYDGLAMLNGYGNGSGNNRR